MEELDTEQADVTDNDTTLSEPPTSRDNEPTESAPFDKTLADEFTSEKRST
jgi:hypothetical protein